jgi:hypothetical protein
MNPILTETHERCTQAVRRDCPRSLDNIVKSFKLTGCKAASGQPGYICDMSWSAPNAFGDQKMERQMRFIKVDGAWKADY